MYIARYSLKEEINGQGMAVREELSPLSGLICEIVNPVGQGNVIFVRKNCISETTGCGNHELYVPSLNFKYGCFMSPSVFNPLLCSL